MDDQNQISQQQLLPSPPSPPPNQQDIQDELVAHCATLNAINYRREVSRIQFEERDEEEEVSAAEKDGEFESDQREVEILQDEIVNGLEAWASKQSVKGARHSEGLLVGLAVNIDRWVSKESARRRNKMPLNLKDWLKEFTTEMQTTEKTLAHELRLACVICSREVLGGNVAAVTLFGLVSPTNSGDDAFYYRFRVPRNDEIEMDEDVEKENDEDTTAAAATECPSVPASAMVGTGVQFSFGFGNEGAMCKTCCLFSSIFRMDTLVEVMFVSHYNRKPVKGGRVYHMPLVNDMRNVKIVAMLK